MQSFRQYRQIGAHFRAQITQDCKQSQRHRSYEVHDAETVGRVLSTTRSRNAAFEDQHSLATHCFDPESRSSLEPQSVSSVDTQIENDETFGPTLSGVEAQDRSTKEGNKGSQVFVVGWTYNDRFDPHNWSTARRIFCTLIVALIGFVVMASSAIDSAVAPQAAAALHVSGVVESLATGEDIPSSRTFFCIY